MYGCEVWNFSEPEINNIVTSWNIAIRKFGTYSNDMLTPVASLNIKAQIHRKSFKPYKRMEFSDNPVVNCTSAVCRRDARSLINRHCCLIAGSSHINNYSLIHSNIHTALNMISQYYNNQMNGSIHTVKMIKEIKRTLEQINNIENFTREELLYIYPDRAVS